MAADERHQDPRTGVVAAGYDRIADRYLEWAGAIVDDPRGRMLARFIELVPAGAGVLELGCGAGIPSTQHLAQHFEVLGVDISPTQVDKARRNVPRAEFVHGDVSELQLAHGSFQGVVALYTISHLPRERHARLFADVYGWLAPGGYFLATLGATDTPDWTGDWLGEPMFFSSHDADTNRRLMRSAGFDLIVDEVAITHEPDGDVPFLWVLAQKPA